MIFSAAPLELQHIVVLGWCLICTFFLRIRYGMPPPLQSCGVSGWLAQQVACPIGGGDLHHSPPLRAARLLACAGAHTTTGRGVAEGGARLLINAARTRHSWGVAAGLSSRGHCSDSAREQKDR